MTELNNIIDGLSSSSKFEQYATAGKALVAGANLMTPETDYAASQLPALCAGKSIDEMVDIMAKILGSVLPMQAAGFWRSCFSDEKSKKIILKLQNSRVVTRLLRVIYGMDPSDIAFDKMSDAEYDVYRDKHNTIINTANKSNEANPFDWYRKERVKIDEEYRAKFPIDSGGE